MFLDWKHKFQGLKHRFQIGKNKNPRRLARIFLVGTPEIFIAYFGFTSFYSILFLYSDYQQVTILLLLHGTK